MDYTKQIREYLQLETRVLEQLDPQAISDAMNLLDEARVAGSRIYVFGNGGSSATASHMLTDFNKGISERIERKFRFECLNDNMPLVMAIANDIGFEEVFRRQLLDRLEPGDVIVAISGSGNSKNVLRAVEYAKSCGCRVIGLTGFDGGKLLEMCDISLHVPVRSMQITEDIHMIFDHLMMSVLSKELAGWDHLAGA